ncbi:MAG: DUF3267 domain-containing protein [Ktedonobacteraceae bacterium]
MIDAGQLQKIDELALLEPEQLRPLARLSLTMLAIGSIIFVLLNQAAYTWSTHIFLPHVTVGSIAAWLGLNIVSYIIILPIHEAIHGLAFALWGGRPHFGAKLPFALYCGARQQLFRRNHYLVIGLAPLVVITLVGIVFTLLAPGLAVYTLLATAGNISGAAGDILAVQRISRLPQDVLIEDTETGYTAWEVPASEAHISRG